MSHETQTSRTTTSELSRKQKLLRRAAPLALLAAGTASIGVYEIASGNDKQASVDVEPRTETVRAHASDTVNGAEDNWGHDTAENVILFAVGEGAVRAIAKLNPEDTITTPNDVAEMIEELPRYDKVQQALEIASEDGTIVQQPGSTLGVTVDVSVTENFATDAKYNYVVDFSIVDSEYSPN